MKIGFFDSGIGGVTVLYEALKILPNEDYIYYADTSHVPYGPKPKEEVKKYVFDAIDFIINQGAKAVVIACNTATSVAVKELRLKYDIPIIGMEPAVKPAIEKNKDNTKRALVTATALTLKEEKLHNLIHKLDGDDIVDLLPLPRLVEFAEKREFNEDVVLPYLKEEFSKFDLSKYETVVLGCTHFPYYKDMVGKLFTQNIDIIDGAKGTTRYLKKLLEEKNCINEGSGQVTFYNSGVKAESEAELEKFKLLFKRLDEINLKK